MNQKPPIKSMPDVTATPNSGKINVLIDQMRRTGRDTSGVIADLKKLMRHSNGPEREFYKEAAETAKAQHRILTKSLY